MEKEDTDGKGIEKRSISVRRFETRRDLWLSLPSFLSLSSALLHSFPILSLDSFLSKLDLITPCLLAPLPLWFVSISWLQ